MARKESKRDIQIAGDGVTRSVMEFFRASGLAADAYEDLGPARWAELEAAERRDVNRNGDFGGRRNG